jgi:hypothetical protein
MAYMTLKSHLRDSLLAAILFGLPVVAHGQASSGPASSGPAGIPVGPLVAYPGIDVTVARDSNLYSSNINRGASWVTTVSPYVKLEGKTGPHSFDLTAGLSQGYYHSSSADNYTDYSLAGNANFVFSGRAGLRLRGEHRYGHDPRGSTDRPSGGNPDEYTNTGLDGIFSYGAPGAQGRIEIDAGAFKREYKNNRAFTVASDRETYVLGGQFFWRIAPKTEFLVGARQRTTDYDLSTSTLDSTERNYFVGAKWEATAATSGTVRFGRLTKDFDSSTRRDFSTNSSWDAAVRWAPLTYSVFDFATSKSSNESSGLGDFIVAKNHTVTWTHAWNSRLSTALNGGYREDDYQGAGVNRTDKTTTYGAKATYQWQRWMRLGAQYQRTDRKSNANLFNYDRDLILFSLNATL